MRDPYVDYLEPDQIDEIVHAVVTSSKSAPELHRPLLVMLDGTVITSADLVKHMANKESRIRAHILNLFAIGIESGEELEEMLDELWEEAPGVGTGSPA